jgi:hypothetical protein
MVFDVAWSAAVGAQPTASLQPVLDHIGPAILELPHDLQQEVGVFGWLDTKLPLVVYIGWAALVASLVVCAMIVSRWRSRLAVFALVGLYAISTTAVTATLMASSGFSAQGRYYLPLMVAVPLLAGWLIAEKVASSGKFWYLLPLAIGLLVSVAQFISWWEDARRYAVGVGGRLMFIFHPVLWSPAGGWWPSAVLAAAGSACLLLAFVLAVVEDWRGPGRQERLHRSLGRL